LTWEKGDEAKPISFRPEQSSTRKLTAIIIAVALVAVGLFLFQMFRAKPASIAVTALSATTAPQKSIAVARRQGHWDESIAYLGANPRTRSAERYMVKVRGRDLRNASAIPGCAKNVRSCARHYAERSPQRDQKKIGI
jgi:hypothetical protein